MINCIEVCMLPSRTPPLQALVLLEVQMGSDSGAAIGDVGEEKEVARVGIG